VSHSIASHTARITSYANPHPVPFGLGWWPTSPATTRTQTRLVNIAMLTMITVAASSAPSANFARSLVTRLTQRPVGDLATGDTHHEPVPELHSGHAELNLRPTNITAQQAGREEARQGFPQAKRDNPASEERAGADCPVGFGHDPCCMGGMMGREPAFLCTSSTHQTGSLDRCDPPAGRPATVVTTRSGTARTGTEDEGIRTTSQPPSPPRRSGGQVGGEGQGGRVTTTASTLLAGLVGSQAAEGMRSKE
jgi:hypothetical protein